MCALFKIRQVTQDLKPKYGILLFWLSLTKVISQCDNYNYIYATDTDNYKLHIWIKKHPSLSDQSSVVPYIHRKLKHKQINSVPICQIMCSF